MRGGVRAAQDGKVAAAASKPRATKRAKIEERRHVVLRALRGLGQTDRVRFEGRLAHALGLSPATIHGDVQALNGARLVLTGDGNRRLGMGPSVGIGGRTISGICVEVFPDVVDPRAGEGS